MTFPQSVLPGHLGVRSLTQFALMNATQFAGQTVFVDNGTQLIEKVSNGLTWRTSAPVQLTAGEIASPTAAILADTSATYILNIAPYTRYVSDGSALVVVGGGASLTNITSAALAALNSGTASATTLYRVTDGSYRDTVYIYDTTSDTLHPIGTSPITFGFA